MAYGHMHAIANGFCMQASAKAIAYMHATVWLLHANGIACTMHASGGRYEWLLSKKKLMVFTFDGEKVNTFRPKSSQFWSKVGHFVHSFGQKWAKLGLKQA